MYLLALVHVNVGLGEAHEADELVPRRRRARAERHLKANLAGDGPHVHGDREVLLNALRVDGVAVGVEVDAQVAGDLVLGGVKSSRRGDGRRLEKAKSEGRAVGAGIVRIVAVAGAIRRR